MNVAEQMREMNNINVTYYSAQENIIQFKVKNFSGHTASTIKFTPSERLLKLTLRPVSKPISSVDREQSIKATTEFLEKTDAPPSISFNVRSYQGSISPHIFLYGTWGSIKGLLERVSKEIRNWQNSGQFYQVRG